MDKWVYIFFQAYIVTLVESPICPSCSGHSWHLVWLPLGHYKHLALHFSIEDWQREILDLNIHSHIVCWISAHIYKAVKSDRLDTLWPQSCNITWIENLVGCISSPMVAEQFWIPICSLVYLHVHQECPLDLTSPGVGRDWILGLGSGTGFQDCILGMISMNPGVRAGARHIFSYPGSGLPVLKFCWPEAGLLHYIAEDLENPGYPGSSAYLNYTSRNMQYLSIKFTKAIYLWNRHLLSKKLASILNHFGINWWQPVSISIIMEQQQITYIS